PRGDAAGNRRWARAAADGARRAVLPRQRRHPHQVRFPRDARLPPALARRPHGRYGPAHGGGALRRAGGGGRAAEHHQREAAAGFPDQQRRVHRGPGGADADPAWPAVRRATAHPAPQAGRPHGGSVPDPRVLARRRPSHRLHAGQPRRGRGAAGVTKVGVVGLGYVGLTLAVALAHRGFVVHGVDKSPRVLDALRQGRPHLFEPGLEEGLAQWIGSRIHVADELPAGEVDVAVICVSTPVDAQTLRPQLENLKMAARHVAERGRTDTLVVVRSTVPVGASRQIVLPELAARWPAPRLAFAPERTMQGQALRELEELPQVVGGLDAASASAAVDLFAGLTRRVVRASSLEAAELVKLVNNCHTDLIYGYGNEVALLAQRFGLDPLEVIHCANV